MPTSPPYRLSPCPVSGEPLHVRDAAGTWVAAFACEHDARAFVEAVNDRAGLVRMVEEMRGCLREFNAGDKGWHERRRKLAGE